MGRRKFSILQFNLSMLLVCVVLIGTSLWIRHRRSDNYLLFSLNKSQPLIRIIPDEFLSFGLDSSLLRDMKSLPISQQKFVNLARHLSPAYVRFGGTAADCLYFKQTEAEDETKLKISQDIKRSPVDGSDISNFTISSNDFLSLYKFTRSAGIRMIFDLNVLLRNADGSWNSDNAKEIIRFAKGHGMELDWQMGNEPNSFFHVFNVKVSAEQLAKDYCELRTILNQSGYQDSILIGPEANHIGDEDHRGADYAEIFLRNVKNCVDYVTWHQYYLNGHIAQVQDFVNSKSFNKLPDEISTVAESIKSSGQNISMWLSETSSAYGGGAPGLSDRFVAGFLWLDKLGYSAKAGVQVVIRQSLFGGNYAMVGHDLKPNPDWWVAVLFKQFVSKTVLDLVAPDNFGNVRLYAHCAPKSVTSNTDTSAVTIYGMNLNQEEARIQIQGPPIESKISSYILTSKDLQSRDILMNEQILQLQTDGSLPTFKPKILEADQVIVLPAYSMVFFILHDMKVTACI